MRSAYSFPLLFGFLLLFGCRIKSPDPIEVSEVATGFVNAHTSSVIGRDDPVQVQFTRQMVDDTQVGQPAPRTALVLWPETAGQSVWQDRQTLVFTPSGPLDSGRDYTALVNLHKLVDTLTAANGQYQFFFRTKRQDFRVESVRTRAAANGDGLTAQDIVGVLETEDRAAPGSVRALLEVTSDGKTLPVEWTTEDDGTTHRFVVADVARTDTDQRVQLNFSGHALGVDRTFTQHATIPARGNFKVTDSRVLASGNRAIELTFSDPLRRNQAFDNYVQLQNYRGSLRFVANGNTLRIFPNPLPENAVTVEVSPGLENSAGAGLQQRQLRSLTYQLQKPQVRLVKTGTILPGGNELLFPFEAVNLAAVEVEVFKIFNNNVLQFLQTNTLDGEGNLSAVGRVVHRERKVLSEMDPAARQNDWHRYAFDLGAMFRDDPAAIYKVRIGFRPEDAFYGCTTDWASFTYSEEPWRRYRSADDADDPAGDVQSIWGSYYGLNGYYDDFDWEDRRDPCRPAYYNYENFVQTNLLASNLGIVAKETDGQLFVVVTDLRTTDPVAEAQIDVFDYQNQLLRSGGTDGSGQARIALDGNPFVLRVRHGRDVGYLRLAGGEALSLSRFDVEGTERQDGMKGLIYGERGVWRPGDTLHLNFALVSAEELPAAYPIEFLLHDARGTLRERRTVTENVLGLYGLPVATDRDAPTGNWTATVRAGGATFTKTLMVETVKPNRLKIRSDLPDRLAADAPAATVEVNWLHGAPGGNLNATVEAQLRSAKTEFARYRDYTFDDPARRIEPEPTVWFDGQTNAAGRFSYQAQTTLDQPAPGRLTATVRTRVFERGGDFSTDVQRVTVDPYVQYVGVDVPTDEYGYQQLRINEPNTVNVAVVDAAGKPVANQRVDVGLYQTDWYWWWDEDNSAVTQYNTDDHAAAYRSQTVRTNSNGVATVTINESEYGSFLIRACADGGHCAGDYFYIGYPWGKQAQSDEAAVLRFSTDKESYTTGETVTVRVPAGGVGRALLTLEDANGVRRAEWRKVERGNNEFQFTAAADMAPTLYVGVMLLQPHGQTANDLPLRLYGVIPIEVTDPRTRLQPELRLPEELAPKASFAVQVREANDRPMAYTVALVDEGLLDLTRFQTPDPHAAFYAREALATRTFDVYQDVVGAYGGQLERILAVGGDAAEVASEENNANRFEPVVRALGPFRLAAGETATHELEMPNYVGSVRAMVVAIDDDGAYGAAEATVPVRQPLMVLATLPRVVGPGETLRLPVNVFAMEDGVRDVTLTVTERSGMVDFTGGREERLRFGGPGDQLANFDLRVGERTGVARFQIRARGAGEEATQNIEIEVRNPNPVQTDLVDQFIAVGDDWTADYTPLGVRGTNAATVEVSVLPPLDLERRLQYLIGYPYGCLEQTTSQGFPQLYLDELANLSESQRAATRRNVQATVNRLQRFLRAEGGFSYWPGGRGVYNEWANSYVGHFLLAARERGYFVPPTLLDGWQNYQRTAAQQWSLDRSDAPENQARDVLQQSYRLYTLALAGTPDRAAMNRLRERTDLSVTARMRLAAAYALIGKREAANQLAQVQQLRPDAYRELGHTFGSPLRDLAMNLETLLLLRDDERAARAARELATSISERRWLSTQESAYALLALGKYAERHQLRADAPLAFSYTLDGETVDVAGDELVHRIALPAERSERVRVRNPNGSPIYARLVRRGQPLTGDERAVSEGLAVAVTYQDRDGADIDPTQLAQGTDFVAVATVVARSDGRYQRYRNLALEQVFPSGWEIQNARLDNLENFEAESAAEHRDFRDDRVQTFFDLNPGETRTYYVGLTAAYEGRYYLPGTQVQAMYDETVRGTTTGRWVEVIRAVGF